MRVFTAVTPKGASVPTTSVTSLSQTTAIFGCLNSRSCMIFSARRLSRRWISVTFDTWFIFQLTFAAITPCLIVGAFAERIKFSAVLLFVTLWFTFAYLPMAHMVWWWAGPDSYTDAAAGAAAAETAGFLFQKGALDFAGGTVVHINAGIAGLVGALMIGKRIGYGTSAMPPHNVPMVMIGASLLWVGWFGFNVGSGLEANGFTSMVFANTILATAAAALAWSFAEWIHRGTPTMLGAASGAVAGLVAITPACGWVGPMSSIAIGILAGLLCLLAVVGLKSKLGYDDSLDVFGVHCVGGIVGALLTAVFCDPALGGTGVYDYVANAVAPYGAWPRSSGRSSGACSRALISMPAWSALGIKLIDLTVGYGVPEEAEREGLDAVRRRRRLPVPGRLYGRVPPGPVSPAPRWGFQPLLIKFSNWYGFRCR